MEMVKVVHTTLDDYAIRVDELASKYGANSWINLRPDVMDADDRFEFTFIQMAVGDLLVRREYFPASGPPWREDSDAEVTVEPGRTPGSTVWWEGSIGRRTICRAN